MNLAVIAIALVNLRRRTPPRDLLILSLVAIVVLNVAFSWRQRPRCSEALLGLGLTGSAANRPERSASDSRPASLNSRLLFLAALVCGSGLGICYAHETKHWLFIPAGVLVGYALGQALLRKYR